MRAMGAVILSDHTLARFITITRLLILKLLLLLAARTIGRCGVKCQGVTKTGR